jgi:nitrite reductase/ring-hydroxylating ferredoxin subunit
VTNEALSRRHALAGAATVGIGVPLLAACGDDAAPESAATGSVSPEASPETSAGSSLGAASDVPVGGGAVFKDQKIVVTQPVKGEFKGFSAVCTHQGCVVASVEDGTINCPCHGSKFSIEDGSVESGPATKPLPDVAVAVAGDEITVA